MNLLYNEDKAPFSPPPFYLRLIIIITHASYVYQKYIYFYTFYTQIDLSPPKKKNPKKKKKKFKNTRTIV